MSSEKQTRRVLIAVVGQDAKGVADHGGARHLAERADMRQAGGAVAGLEQHLARRSPRRLARSTSFRASSKGQALETRAASSHSAGNSLMTRFVIVTGATRTLVAAARTVVATSRNQRTVAHSHEPLQFVARMRSRRDIASARRQLHGGDSMRPMPIARRSFLPPLLRRWHRIGDAPRRCGNDSSGFKAWVEAFKPDAAAQGISQRTVDAALNGVNYSNATIRLDRNQKVFKQSFETVLRAHDPAAHEARQEPARQACEHLRPHRAAVRRAEGDRRRHLGAGDGFRRGAAATTRC